MMSMSALVQVAAITSSTGGCYHQCSSTVRLLSLIEKYHCLWDVGSLCAASCISENATYMYVMFPLNAYPSFYIQPTIYAHTHHWLLAPPTN